ncbi:MAG: VIT1/CCC1 transporter family protein, partial [Halobacteriales archaeon]|nr:VIT1/CCC1 transporter family protein [Halobacteriales archaeon]
IVLILGAANLFADGFSMGMSNYLSRRSEIDYRETTGLDGSARSGGFEEGKSPRRTAAVTFLAFVIAGWAPLIPYILEVSPAFPLSIAFTGLTFFVVGASRSLVTSRRWFVNGGEMFLVGMLAAGVAYSVGSLLKGFA